MWATWARFMIPHRHTTHWRWEALTTREAFRASGPEHGMPAQPIAVSWSWEQLLLCSGDDKRVCTRATVYRSITINHLLLSGSVAFGSRGSPRGCPDAVPRTPPGNPWCVSAWSPPSPAGQSVGPARSRSVESHSVAWRATKNKRPRERQ